MISGEMEEMTGMKLSLGFKEISSQNIPFHFNTPP